MNQYDIARSTAGRDAGKYFVVVKLVDEQYCLISDGKLRKVEKPKKKKMKHLLYITDEKRQILDSREPITNKTIRSVLAEIKANKGEE